LTQQVSVLRARRWLAAPDRVGDAPAEFVLRDGLIASVARLPADAAGPDRFAMPALANAHDHGRGLRPLGYGAFDQPLETWFTALNIHPPIDPYVNAACAFARMARSGIGLAVHCHMATATPALIDDAAAVCRAAEDVGIRLAFVVPMRDRFRLGYLPDEAVLARLPAAQRDAVRARWIGPMLPAEAQLAIADEIARRCTSQLVDVLYGPAAAHWCTDRMMALVAEASARTGRRVHVHCLETPLQREFADASFPGGLFPFMRRIGLLSDRLTLAHGVHLRPAEMDMIAESGAIVSLNSCSNLRLRSGIAPAPEMARRRVRLAVGIDALGLDDEEDGLRELRLTGLLHAGVGLETGLGRSALLQAALGNGARAVTGRANHGALAAGMAADILLLDFAALSGDVMPGMTADIDIVLARATGRHVASLVVAGREIVREGSVLGVDLPALEATLIEQTQAAAADYLAARPLTELLQETLRGCYRDGLHRQGD
jgi:cytosine/adenosine deaminase-related metal-dependent hydrolase